MQTRGDRTFDGSLVLSTTAVIPALLEDAARLGRGQIIARKPA